MGALSSELLLIRVLPRTLQPTIAKLSVIQNRLYYIKVKANRVAPTAFFDQPSVLRDDMEAIAESFNSFPINFRCLEQSNKGVAPPPEICSTLKP